MKIREYVNRLLRTEAPAHVHLKICWVSNRQLRVFEWRYRQWLEENADAIKEHNERVDSKGMYNESLRRF